MIDDEPLEVAIPVGASNAEEERLIQAALNKKIDDDIDGVLRDLGTIA